MDRAGFPGPFSLRPEVLLLRADSRLPSWPGPKAEAGSHLQACVLGHSFVSPVLTPSKKRQKGNPWAPCHPASARIPLQPRGAPLQLDSCVWGSVPEHCHGWPPKEFCVPAFEPCSLSQPRPGSQQQQSCPSRSIHALPFCQEALLAPLAHATLSLPGESEPHPLAPALTLSCAGLSLFFRRLCHLINALGGSFRREDSEHLLFLPDSPTLEWAQRGSEAVDWLGEGLGPAPDCVPQSIGCKEGLEPPQ